LDSLFKWCFIPQGLSTCPKLLTSWCPWIVYLLSCFPRLRKQKLLILLNPEPGSGIAILFGQCIFKKCNIDPKPKGRNVKEFSILFNLPIAACSDYETMCHIDSCTVEVAMSIRTAPMECNLLISNRNMCILTLWPSNLIPELYPKDTFKNLELLWYKIICSM
jgi:hypothetical protein